MKRSTWNFMQAAYLVAFLIGFSLASSAQTNLVQNHSFEQGATNGNEVAANWNKINSPAITTCFGACQDGSKAVLFGMPGMPSSGNPVIYTDLPIQQGTTIDMSFYTKESPQSDGTGTSIRVYLIQDPLGGAPLTTNNINTYTHQLVYWSPVITGTTWQQHSFTFTANGSYDYLWVDPHAPSPVLAEGQEIYLDNFSVIENIRSRSCVRSFAPLVGEKYVLSAWAYETSPVGKVTYANAGVEVVFEDGQNTVLGTAGPFTPAGPIVDSWQRIEGQFTVPANTEFVAVRLLNSATTDYVYYDDIRVFPTDGNMVSYVYDPVNLRLVAELDDNNYAILYEYDEEGQLIRVKRETERGVMTVTETRQNTHKP